MYRLSRLHLIRIPSFTARVHRLYHSSAGAVRSTALAGSYRTASSGAARLVDHTSCVHSSSVVFRLGSQLSAWQPTGYIMVNSTPVPRFTYIICTGSLLLLLKVLFSQTLQSELMWKSFIDIWYEPMFGIHLIILLLSGWGPSFLTHLYCGLQTWQVTAVFDNFPSQHCTQLFSILRQLVYRFLFFFRLQFHYWSLLAFTKLKLLTANSPTILLFILWVSAQYTVNQIMHFARNCLQISFSLFSGIFFLAVRYPFYHIQLTSISTSQGYCRMKIYPYHWWSIPVCCLCNGQRDTHQNWLNGTNEGPPLT